VEFVGCYWLTQQLQDLPSPDPLDDIVITEKHTLELIGNVKNIAPSRGFFKDANARSKREKKKASQ